MQAALGMRSPSPPAAALRQMPTTAQSAAARRTPSPSPAAEAAPPKPLVRQQTQNELMEEQKKVSVAASIRRQAQQFMEADQDGDQRLDFEEWMGMLPKATKQGRSVEQLRQIFSVADLDGDGTLSLDEYVALALIFTHHMRSILPLRASGLTRAAVPSTCAAYCPCVRPDSHALPCVLIDVPCRRFFMWTLSLAAMQAGSHAEATFQRFDKDGSTLRAACLLACVRASQLA